MLKKTISILSLYLISASLNAQTLSANAGNDAQICPGVPHTIGGTPTASGGTGPYTYFWYPSAGLSNTGVPNPISNPAIPTWYVVTVTDAVGNTDVDTVFIDLDPSWHDNAGNDTSICVNSPPIQIGGIYNDNSGGITYTWSPSTGLDNVNLPRPTCSTTTTITYSVIITSPNCGSKPDYITVTVNPLPVITACCDQTINEGQSAILTGTGGFTYGWFGNPTISNPTGNPVTVEPVITSTYTLFGQDANGCESYDTLVVTVIPSNELYFYNTFTPNNDGINDYFYIGNIYKYPDNRLEVYTRTGQQVFAKTGYLNDWNGTNYGDKLPEATYYYVLDLGDGSPKIYKSVTIVR